MNSPGLVLALRLRCGHDSRSVDGCIDCEAADALEALPAGWVPREPTQEMLEAPNSVVHPYAAKLVWQRMWDAAPKCMDCAYNPGLCDTHDALTPESLSERVEHYAVLVEAFQNKLRAVGPMVPTESVAITGLIAAAREALKDAERWRATSEHGFPHLRAGAGYFIPGAGLGFFPTKAAAADAAIEARRG